MTWIVLLFWLARSPSAALVPCLPSCQQETDFASLERDWKAAMRLWKEEIRVAKGEGQKRSAWPEDPTTAYYPRFEALAFVGEGRAAVWMAEHLRDAYTLSGRREAAQRLMDLVAEAQDASWVGQILVPLAKLRGDLDSTRFQAYLEGLTHESRPGPLRFLATYVLGDILEAEDPVRGMELLLQACTLAGDLESANGSAAIKRFFAAVTRSVTSGEPARVETALALMSEVTRRWPDSQAAEEAERQLFRLQHLSVGRDAPDFEAQDVEGNAFKLSDYKGKVTLIDFWGFW